MRCGNWVVAFGGPGQLPGDRIDGVGDVFQPADVAGARDVAGAVGAPAAVVVAEIPACIDDGQAWLTQPCLQLTR